MENLYARQQNHAQMKHIVYVDTKDTETITELSDLLINDSYSKVLQHWSFDLKTFRAQSTANNKSEEFLHTLNFNNQNEYLINYKSLTSTEDDGTEKGKVTIVQNGVKISKPSNYNSLLQNGCFFDSNNNNNNVIVNKVLNANKKWQQRQSVSGKHGLVFKLSHDKTVVRVINVYTSSNDLKGCILEIDSPVTSTVNDFVKKLNTQLNRDFPLLDSNETSKDSDFNIIRNYIQFLDL